MIAKRLGPGALIFYTCNECSAFDGTDPTDQKCSETGESLHSGELVNTPEWCPRTPAARKTIGPCSECTFYVLPPGRLTVRRCNCEGAPTCGDPVSPGYGCTFWKEKP